jgi:hypothetical protein
MIALCVDGECRCVAGGDRRTAGAAGYLVWPVGAYWEQSGAVWAAVSQLELQNML